jgi:hydroxyacylglutathione hydrolase
MILKRFYDDKLAQASYLVGCAATGDALVVDPNRDVAQYIDAAEAEGLRITDVTETHIHADYVSGLRELVDRTGAQAHVSDEGGPDWSYGFAADIGAVLLKDGAEFSVGNIRVQAVHTPGHTPEHISFLITDTAGADRPMGAFTGDFIFVGDVGRPDLLEKAAGVAGTMEAGARQLHGSLQRFRTLPDWLQLWPGHGAGSACGKALGAVPSTTLGYEKLFNWGFGHESETDFVDAVLAGQPEPPKYFAEMKRMNRDGPRVLGGFQRPQRGDVAELERVVRDGGVVVDTRPWEAFRAGHVPGTVNIPLNRSFTTWAGWLLPYDRDFFVIAPEEPRPAAGADAAAGAAGVAAAAGGAALDEALRDLAMIGLDRAAAWFPASAVAAYGEAHGGLARVAEVTPAEALDAWRRGSVRMLDVRGQGEWDAGHIPGASHIPLGYLADRLDEVPRDQPVVVHCKSGGRSAIATSLLTRAGFTDVVNLAGGFDGWVADGNEVEHGQVTAPAL